MVPRLTRQILEAAAGDVLNILKEVEDFKDASIAVIGGLALWNCLPQGRTTEDVDFIINIDTAPNSVKQKLLSLPQSPFVQNAQLFQYKTPGGNLVQIDIVPSWQSLYMPTDAVQLKHLPAKCCRTPPLPTSLSSRSIVVK